MRHSFRFGPVLSRAPSPPFAGPQMPETRYAVESVIVIVADDDAAGGWCAGS